MSCKCLSLDVPNAPNKMVVTLYGTSASAPVRAVQMVISKLNLSFVKFVNVNLLKEEQKAIHFLKMNPQHSIPTLKDNDFIVWDSHAITAYLIAKYAKDDSLYPSEPKQRAIIDQRLHFDSGILFPALRDTITPLVFGGSKSYDKESINKISIAYDFAEKFLTHPWMAGDSLTLADICCYATISTLNVVLPINEKQYPNLSAWLQRCFEQVFIKKGNEEGLASMRELLKSRLE